MLDQHDQLAEVDHAPDDNTFGMVARVITLKNHEYPDDRKVALVTNDITYRTG